MWAGYSLLGLVLPAGCVTGPISPWTTTFEGLRGFPHVCFKPCRGCCDECNPPGSCLAGIRFHFAALNAGSGGLDDTYVGGEP